VGAGLGQQGEVELEEAEVEGHRDHHQHHAADLKWYCCNLSHFVILHRTLPDLFPFKETISQDFNLFLGFKELYLYI
jgi:hypothetical protein